MNSGRARRLERILLGLLFLLALGLRGYRIGQQSLAEDEAAKWQAIGQYRQGHFAAVNSEHPMVMKVLAWGSLAAGERYNRWAAAHGHQPIAREAWLRLPVVLLGAATTLVLYLLGRQLLGMLGAGLAAVFWAFSPLSVSLNRVLKEEVLFTFFTLLAFYLYNRAKLAATEREARWCFLLAGGAFGMDLASYYLAIGQFGLIVLVWHIANKYGIRSRQMGPYFRRLVLVMGLVFVVMNPVILSPKNLKAMTRYSEEKTIEHRGYLIDGQVLLNNALTTPYGLPWYFYLWVLAVKTPLPVLAAMAAGMLLLFFDRRSLISIFLRVMLTFWFVPYSLAGSKWIRYLLIILPALYLGGGWAAEKLAGWLRVRMRERGWQAAMAGMTVALVAWPLAAATAWSPYNRLYLNALGGGEANAGRLFPPDEVYDLGVRPAARYVCRVAPPGAVVAGSDPMGLEFYAHAFGREDLRVVPLFDPNYAIHRGDFLLVQDSRRYFETDSLLTLIERTQRPARVVRIDGLVTAAVYDYDPGRNFAGRRPARASRSTARGDRRARPVDSGAWYDRSWHAPTGRP